MEPMVNGGPRTMPPTPVLIPVASYANGGYIPKHYKKTRESCIALSYKGPEQNDPTTNIDSDSEMDTDQPKDLSLFKKEHPKKLFQHRNEQMTPPSSLGEGSPLLEEDSPQMQGSQSPYLLQSPHSHKNKSPDMGNNQIQYIPHTPSPNSHSNQSPYRQGSQSPYRQDSESPQIRDQSQIETPGLKRKLPSDIRTSYETPSEDEPTDLSIRDVGPEENGEEIDEKTLTSEWSFEEQFKQLYELTDDPDRKVFLDKLFIYMQKRGTPVNRIPIMAKQVLDLYELFKLVTSKGGLVEVINKKMWREITKGLNLPSSITSAAFTLRTQYMKYLYPYECETKGLSTPEELQSAIDNNRREGRRNYQTHAGYALHEPQSPSPTMIPIHSSIPITYSGFYRPHMHPASIPSNLSSSGDEESLPPTPRPSKHHHSPIVDHGGPLPSKRPLMPEEAYQRFLMQQQHLMYPTTHLKISTSRSELGSGMPLFESRSDNSMVVSMEINGILYQGVLHPLTVPGHPLHRKVAHTIKT
ncbi:protein dead ringer homolog [Anneissia japonica]|uniref:protein dead ringer homolog n=1 Tax=Anneissia japonica TaxID=1529436 RepID=UPI001425532E|nr:protein dead ringer homolog [Anneissia japonica]